MPVNPGLTLNLHFSDDFVAIKTIFSPKPTLYIYNIYVCSAFSIYISEYSPEVDFDVTSELSLKENNFPFSGFNLDLKSLYPACNGPH